eukprot:c13186_g1_i1.p2 GENE.c13186_g1_i1~~c13186_g1_i1.p2  ORF type:complete len:143 (-),score=23.53 c13186_g1_i1:353-781(-)
MRPAHHHDETQSIFTGQGNGTKFAPRSSLAKTDEMAALFSGNTDSSWTDTDRHYGTSRFAQSPKKYRIPEEPLPRVQPINRVLPDSRNWISRMFSPKSQQPRTRSGLYRSSNREFPPSQNAKFTRNLVPMQELVDEDVRTFR